MTTTPIYLGHPTTQTYFWHPTTERIFQLKDLQVPPQNYSGFLAQVVDGFTQLVLQYHGVQTLDEVVGKYKRELKEANPDKSEEDLFQHLFSPVGLRFSGQLRYQRVGSERVPNQVYQSQEHTEDLFDPRSGTRIPLGDYQQQLAGIVETIRQELDKRYPDREGHLTNSLFRRTVNGEEQDIRQFLYEFGFNLHLQSVPTGRLETDVTLRDYGATSKDASGIDTMIAIPAISIRAKTLAGQLEFPQKVVDTLGGLVTNHYKINETENRQSYVIPTR